MNPKFEKGDLVIYTMTKQSPQPGPRARSVYPAQSGDDYSYVVDKFWMVADVVNGNQVVIVTRTGKTRGVRANDPQLKKANWWQRLRFHNRFPSPDILQTAAVDRAPQKQLQGSVASH